MYFNCDGIWWLPHAPDDKVAGSLIFAKESGIHLKLAGVFGEPAPHFADKAFPIILGVVWDCPHGKLITLKDCHIKRTQFSVPGIAREEYFANRIFAGEHIDREEEFQFSEAFASFSGLPNWAEMLSGLKQEHEPEGFTIHWRRQEAIAGPIPGGKVTLGTGASYSVSGFDRTWSITEDVSFHIEADAACSADELNRRYIFPLQNFLTLATDHPNAVTEFSVRKPGAIDRVKVLAPRTFSDPKLAADVLPHRMLFSLRDVHGQAAALLSRWIELSDDLSEAVNPYFSSQYKPSQFTDTNYLVVFQSLESYHRARFHKLGTSLIPTASELREIVGGLLREHHETVHPIFPNDERKVIDQIIGYRNFVVHRVAVGVDDKDYGQTLFWLTKRLSFLMKACLLTELGISKDIQKQLFSRSSMFEHIAGMTAKEQAGSVSA